MSVLAQKYCKSDDYIASVTVSSSLDFDGFLLTGLYTTATTMAPQRQTFGQPTGQNLMCSLVHQHMAMTPVHELQFVWMAPPTGTGCVSFM